MCSQGSTGFVVENDTGNTKDREHRENITSNKNIDYDDVENKKGPQKKKRRRSLDGAVSNKKNYSDWFISLFVFSVLRLVRKITLVFGLKTN